MVQVKDHKPFTPETVEPTGGNGRGNGGGNGGGNGNAGGNGNGNGNAGGNGNGTINGNGSTNGNGGTNGNAGGNGNGNGNGGANGNGNGNGNGNSTAVDLTAGDITTTATLAVGETVSDAIELRGDQDWFRVELTAGTTYQFGTAEGAASPLADAVIAIYDASGNLITGNDDANGSLQASLLYTADADGVFYIAVSGYGNATGSYDVSMDEVDLNDALAADASTAGSIAIGETVSGQVDFTGDHDWFAFDITSTQSITFATAAGAGTAVGDTVITIYDAAGNVLASNDDNGTDYYSSLEFAASAGTYYVAVSGYQDSVSGSYELSASLGHEATNADVSQMAEYIASTWFADMGANAAVWSLDASRTLSYDLTGLDASLHDAVRNALGAWGDAAVITFVEQVGGALSFASGTGNSTTVDSVSGIIQSAVVTLDGGAAGMASANSAAQAIMQEIGRALGLGHSGSYTNGTAVSYDARNLVYANDSSALSVMSGFDNASNEYFAARGFSSVNAITPMMADIAAIQILYGAATGTRTGDDTYGFNTTAGALYDGSANGDAAYTIVDSGGIDTLDYSQFGNDQVINLFEGKFMNIGGLVGNVAIAMGTVIENAMGGAGNDQVMGNLADNVLQGMGGNDLMGGYAGNDTIDGGDGDDLLYGHYGNDTLSAASGLNRMFGQFGDDILLGGTGFDKLFGGSGNDQLFGGDGDDFMMSSSGTNYMEGGNGSDVMIGGSGNDTLIGGDDHGWDKLRGGAGDDVLISGWGSDQLTGGEGNDWMDAGGAADFLNGKEGNDTMFGGRGNDILWGGTGDDILDGGMHSDRLLGERGNDILTGGEGADFFIFNNYDGVDQITDFESGVDQIELLRPAFTEIRFGTLWESAFTLGTQAADAGDRIIYDQATGNIWYDPDGTGAQEQILFAQVTAGTALSASDFYATGASPTFSEGPKVDPLLGADATIV